MGLLKRRKPGEGTFHGDWSKVRGDRSVTARVAYESLKSPSRVIADLRNKSGRMTAEQKKLHKLGLLGGM